MSSLLSPPLTLSRSSAASFARPLIWASLALPWLWGLSQLFPPLNHDVGAVLQWSGRMLAGERLYVDINDVNPPLIYWLNLIPAGLARLTGLPAPLAFALSVLATIAASLMLARPLFAKLAPAGSFAALTLPGLALFVLLVYPQGSFGQREHLLVILTLPYLLLATARALLLPIDGRSAALIGLVAAIGIGIKPHFAFLPVLIELNLLMLCGWRARLRDPAPWAIAGFGIAYLLAARLIHPEFFSHELPLAMRYYERGLGWHVLLEPQSLGVLLALIPLSLAAFMLRSARLAQILALAALADLIGACLQGRGWDYHFLPANGAVILLGGALATGLLDRWSAAMPAWPKAALGGVALVMTLLLSGNLSPPFRNQLIFKDSPAGHALPMIRAAAQGKPVLWFTTSIYPQFPVLNYTDSTLAMPNESLWLLPALYADGPAAADGNIQFHALGDMPAAEAEMFEETVAMAVRLKPALIITTDSWAEPGYYGRNFDYLAYFGRDPRFTALFADYRPLSKLGAWTFYERLPGR
jgi:hypothetical protein